MDRRSEYQRVSRQSTFKTIGGAPMKFKSQRLAYYFFALSMLLLGLQLVYGFIMGFAHIGMDGLHQ